MELFIALIYFFQTVVWTAFAASDCPTNCRCIGSTVECSMVSEVPRISQNTTVLNLADNLISSIEVGIYDGLVHLEEMDLSDNMFSTLKDGYFNGLTSLKILDLSDNNIRKIKSEVFKELKNLLELKLDNNWISELKTGCFKELSNLTTLDLSHNYIKKIGSGVLQDLQNLLKLILDSNKILEVNAKFFQGLHNLNLLSDKSNNISSVSNQTVAHLTELKYLKLEENPLVCGCDMQWVIHSRTKITGTCSESSLEIDSMTEDDFDCNCRYIGNNYNAFKRTTHSGHSCLEWNEVAVRNRSYWIYGLSKRNVCMNVDVDEPWCLANMNGTIKAEACNTKMCGSTKLCITAVQNSRCKLTFTYKQHMCSAIQDFISCLKLDFQRKGKSRCAKYSDHSILSLISNRNDITKEALSECFTEPRRTQYEIHKLSCSRVTHIRGDCASHLKLTSKQTPFSFCSSIVQMVNCEASKFIAETNYTCSLMEKEWMLVNLVRNSKELQEKDFNPLNCSLDLRNGIPDYSNLIRRKAITTAAITAGTTRIPLDSNSDDGPDLLVYLIATLGFAALLLCLLTAFLAIYCFRRMQIRKRKQGKRIVYRPRLPEPDVESESRYVGIEDIPARKDKSYQRLHTEMQESKTDSCYSRIHQDRDEENGCKIGTPSDYLEPFKVIHSKDIKKDDNIRDVMIKETGIRVHDKLNNTDTSSSRDNGEKEVNVIPLGHTENLYIDVIPLGPNDSFNTKSQEHVKIVPANVGTQEQILYLQENVDDMQTKERSSVFDGITNLNACNGDSINTEKRKSVDVPNDGEHCPDCEIKSLSDYLEPYEGTHAKNIQKDVNKTDDHMIDVDNRGTGIRVHDHTYTSSSRDIKDKEVNVSPLGHTGNIHTDAITSGHNRNENNP